MSDRSDPMEALRTPVTPVAPDPRFAAGLRARLVRALLAPTAQEEPMTDVLLRNDLSRNGTRPGDISYISLAVPDPALARAFYGTVLGWAFAPGQVEHEGNQVEEVIPQVGLWGGPQPSGAAVHGAVLAFRVDDLAAAVAAVRDHGGTASDPRREPYGLTADCRDDQGMEFCLHELPAAGRPAPANGAQQGDVSYVTLLVGDAERAVAFYGAVLGWAFTPGRSAGGANVEGPTPMVGMAGDSGGRPGAVLGYRVDDAAATAALVRQAGGTASDPVQRPYGLASDCADDQGTPFYLHQIPG